MAQIIPGFSRANVKELERGLHKIWSLGANVIVGWQVGAYGLKVLHLSSYALARAAETHPDLLAGDRYLGSGASAQRLAGLGAKTTSLALSFDVPTDDNVILSINRFIRRFSITHCPLRCVSLFDIVDFSKYSHFDQITLITMLAHHLYVAARQCNRLGLPVKLAMTTTGDGFYVWNGKQGLDADVASYTVAMLALIYNNAALNIAANAAVPTLRCAIHFGSHFEYYQPHGDGGASQGFIVGDVTIELARMMSVALPNQILIGRFGGAGGEESPYADRGVTDTATFMTAARKGLGKLANLRIPGGRIAAIRCYLTGEQQGAGRFTVKSYRVIGKHDLEYPCFNAKLNFTDSGGNEIYIGCMDAELSGFAEDASAAE